MSTSTSTSTSTGFGRIGAVILAAGRGTRMYSDTPKVLQRLLDEPMLRYVFEAVTPLCAGRVRAVVGHGAEQVVAAFPGREETWVEQREQLGTGHALAVAWPRVLELDCAYTLVINGDTPLARSATLAGFLEQSLEREADAAFITLTPADPGAFGRVVRREGRVAAIIEARDYDPAAHGPDSGEINAGVYCFRTATIGPLLPLLGNANKSGEIYITDLIGLAVARGLRVYGHQLGDDADLLGINTPLELVRAEERLREQTVESHLRAGVLIRAAQAVRIGPDVRLAPGVEITGPCELYGRTSVAAGARIASHCLIKDAAIGEGVRMHSFCHVEQARVEALAVVGPYARLRPGAELEEGAHVGNFVEMKKARLGRGAKANHLTYLGDAEIGAGANIGAGTITCNYDGKNKHRTEIGAGAFIGSNTALVAPVRVGERALVGAGSVITREVPDDHLGITRAAQHTVRRLK